MVFQLAKKGVLIEIQRAVTEENVDVEDMHDFESFKAVSACWIAAFEGHVDVVKFMIRLPEVLVDRKELDRGWAPLHAAAAQGHAAIVRALIKRGADMNIQDESDRTPLHIATEWGRVAVMRTLLAMGASRSILDGHDRTAEQALQHRGRPDASIRFFTNWEKDRQDEQEFFNAQCEEEDREARERSAATSATRTARRQAGRRAWLASRQACAEVPAREPLPPFIQEQLQKRRKNEQKQAREAALAAQNNMWGNVAKAANSGH